MSHAGSHDEAEELEELLRRRRKKGHGGGHMPGEDITSLNLTPLMDIMTILLVFLIQSLAVEPSNINVTLALRPPESNATATLEASTKVTISTEAILVDEKPVVLVPELKIDALGEQGIPAVRDGLKAAADNVAAMEKFGGAPFDGKLLVVAHETTPYALVSAVLTSAGFANYSQFRLVVMKKGDK